MDDGGEKVRMKETTNNEMICKRKGKLREEEEEEEEEQEEEEEECSVRRKNLGYCLLMGEFDVEECDL